MKKLILLLMVLSIVGCASMPFGTTYEEAIYDYTQAFGQPDNIIYGNKTKLLSWDDPYRTIIVQRNDIGGWRVTGY